MFNNNDTVSHDGGHTPANMLIETHSLGLKHSSLILDIHLMVNWQNEIAVLVSHNYIAGSFHRGHMFFKEDHCSTAGFRLAHVRLTCCKQGRIVRKRVDTNPRLKIDQIIYFSCIQMFFTAFVWCIFIKLKTEGQTIYRKQSVSPLTNPWGSRSPTINPRGKCLKSSQQRHWLEISCNPTKLQKTQKKISLEVFL